MWQACGRVVCSSIQTCIPHGHLHRVTYTRGRIDTTDSPDDEHLDARNMYTIGIYKYTKNNCASNWSFIKINKPCLKCIVIDLFSFLKPKGSVGYISTTKFNM